MKTDNPARKTQYDLVAVYKNGLGWVNIDSQAINQVMKEWLNSGPALFENITVLKSEYTYGKCRVDFYLECYSGKSLRKILIEVKGCTLEIDGISIFLTPTGGVKHLWSLQKRWEKDMNAILFCYRHAACPKSIA